MAADPAPTPHLTQLRRAAGLGFVSGQVALVPGSTEPLGDIAAQTHAVLTALERVLKDNGLTLTDVVQVSVYLANPADFVAMNDVYAKFFPSNPPARTTTAVALMHPELLIEVDAVVDLKEG